MVIIDSHKISIETWRTDLSIIGGDTLVHETMWVVILDRWSNDGDEVWWVALGRGGSSIKGKAGALARVYWVESIPTWPFEAKSCIDDRSPLPSQPSQAGYINTSKRAATFRHIRKQRPHRGDSDAEVARCTDSVDRARQLRSKRSLAVVLGVAQLPLRNRWGMVVRNVHAY